MTTTTVLSLGMAANMFGRLSQDVIDRLEKVISDPNEETWEDAHCIILSMNGGVITLWNAVLEVDPTYLRRKSMDAPWGDIPSSGTISKAISNLLLKPTNLN
jgi:hypothetical protein